MNENLLVHYNQHKKLFFNLAYKMLGNITEAEDILQECFVKAKKVDFSTIEHPKAYLSKIITNLCIDRLYELKELKESYKGVWLPDPFIVDNEYYFETLDNISYALMLTMERLSPIERAVFILRESFEFEYTEITEIVKKSEVNCRQILHRAKDKLASTQGGKNSLKTSSKHQELIFSFFQACKNGDMEKLVNSLEKDIVLFSDGGGKVKAAINPIYGFEKVSRFLIGISKQTPQNLTFKIKVMNGEQSIVFYIDEKIHSIFIFKTQEKIENIFIIINPDKLKNYY